MTSVVMCGVHSHLVALAFQSHSRIYDKALCPACGDELEELHFLSSHKAVSLDTTYTIKKNEEGVGDISGCVINSKFKTIIFKTV